jgi:uncharacterized cupredoxin-like copper-binding protein
MPTRAAYLAATALAIVALAFTGCSDDDDGSSGSEDTGSSGGGGYGYRDGAKNEAASGAGGKRTVLPLSADPGGELRFNKSSQGQGVEEESDTIGPGATTRVPATLEPGEYEFYCPVGDHKDAGMEGALTVN